MKNKFITCFKHQAQQDSYKNLTSTQKAINSNLLRHFRLQFKQLIMKKIILFISILYYNFSFSQNSQDSFSKGLSDGWRETLQEAKNIDILSAGSPDSWKCQSNSVYVPNDKEIFKKEYSRGYRCGVEQATKIIPTLEGNTQNLIKNKSNYNGAEINIDGMKNTDELNSMRLTEISNIHKYGYSTQEENTRIQIINLKYDKLETEINRKSNTSRQLESEIVNKKASPDNTGREAKNQQINNNLMNYYNQQQASQQDYNRKMEDQMDAMIQNTVNQLQMQMVAANQKELKRRQTVANNFINNQSKNLEEIIKNYNKIPLINFKLNLDGIYSSYMIREKRFSFLNNNTATNVIPCLVEVNNKEVKNIFMYGNEEMNVLSNFNLKDFNLINGKIELDLKTTLVVIEPYYMNNEKLVYSLLKDKVGYISLWSSNKDDEGKLIHIQELDKNGNIIREVSRFIKYYKNEKSIDKDGIPKIAINTGNNLLYFGEPTQTPFGFFSLYPKMNKKYFLPIEPNEQRFVEIKKYRD